MAAVTPPVKSVSIRRQLLVSTLVLQTILVAGFIALLTGFQMHNQTLRSHQRLLQQSDLMAQSATLSLEDNDIDSLTRIMRIERRSTTLAAAQIVDPEGRAIVHFDPTLAGKNTLGRYSNQLLEKPLKRQLLGTGRDLIAATPITSSDGKVLGLAVVQPNFTPDTNQTILMLRWSVGYALIALLANAIAAFVVARNIARPVQALMGATEQVAGGADPRSAFPMDTRTTEVGRLVIAFNSMTETLQKRNANLNDTLSLLDSMLTNAPVGFAFFDRRTRFVRLNQTMADVAGASIARHLGRGAREMLPPEMEQDVERHVREVFETGATLRDVELTSGTGPAIRCWLSNFFAVRAADGTVRWTGVIFTDITERRRTEEMLRRTEKLAAAGRLAASIAHEINNPLEGVTNLLYLLRMSDSLDDEARNYVQMAQHEVSRVSEITQQTLRFHRQSMHPVEIDLQELFNGVTVLYGGKISAAGLEVQRRFRTPSHLFALAGELRQVFANLVGNAIDASRRGGTLTLRVAPSQDWRNGEPGLRVTVADTGSGMDEATRKRIFEPFFTTKDATGTGLGLWVSAEILAKHNARLTMRSRKATSARPGGTVFYVFFPHRGLELIPEKQAAPAE